MDITNNMGKQPGLAVRDVRPGQVFSFASGASVLLMTDSARYVRLTDGSMGTLAISDMDKRVKIYEHELILKGFK